MKKVLRNFWKLYRKFGIPGLWAGIKILRSKVKILEINLPGYSTIHLRTNSSDIDAFYQVIVDEEINLKMEEPRFVIDLGANVGLFALKIKSAYPDVKIVCVEPDPSNVEILKHNTNCFEDIKVIPKAIWHENTELALATDEKGNWGKTVHAEPSQSESTMVSTITMDELLDQEGIEEISILKVDIEGSEKELFEAQDRKWLEKVGILIIELHDRKKAGTAKSVFRAVCEREFYYPYQQENLIFKFSKS